MPKVGANRKRKANKRRNIKMMQTSRSDARNFLLHWCDQFLQSERVDPTPSNENSNASAIAWDGSFDTLLKSLDPSPVSIIDLHSHSTHSDGELSPSELVLRASKNGVKILALTDHDTMSGVAEAFEAGKKYGVRIIPGVEISTFIDLGNNERENIHILGYFGACGMNDSEKFHSSLHRIRHARISRAQSMVEKLCNLNAHVSLERVLEIAGKETYPGRVHVAKALLENGHVANFREAFTKYLGDDGPAYVAGEEMEVEDAIRMIKSSGGVCVLAHPWAIKKQTFDVINKLCHFGIQGIEYFRASHKELMFGDIADEFKLLKVGGSDFHGSTASEGVELGHVSFPADMAKKFIEFADLTWKNALQEKIRIFFNSINPNQNVNKTSSDANNNNIDSSVTDDFTNLNFNCGKGGVEMEKQWGSDCTITDNELWLSKWMLEEDRVLVSSEATLLGLELKYVNLSGDNFVVLSAKSVDILSRT